jgi:hydrogenase large subunit
MASVRCLDEALGYTSYDGAGAASASIPKQGRILRNIVEGADMVMSHILHFYHLAALDYLDTQVAGSLLKGVSYWDPTAASGRTDVIGGATGTTSATVNIIITHYVWALNMRRKAHELAAWASGKQPHTPFLIPGGVTAISTDAMTAAMDALLGTATATTSSTTLLSFIKNVYFDDVTTVAKLLSSTLLVGTAADGVGAGCKKYLAYGTFPYSGAAIGQPINDLTKGLLRGGYLDTTTTVLSGAPWGWTLTDVDKWKIKEQIKYSHYESGLAAAADYDNRGPWEGVTKVDYKKPVTGGTPANSYSWGKAPRYNGNVCEVGPLARVLVNYAANNTPVVDTVNDYMSGTLGLSVSANIPNLRSVLGRHAARMLECKIVAGQLQSWMAELGAATSLTGQTYRHRDLPTFSATGAGFTEAPRGALSHWIRVDGKKISNYQCVVPTTWNVSPKGTDGINGPIEQALSGTSVSTTGAGDANHLLKLTRIIRSFDPCIACTVHVVSPDKKTVAKFEIGTAASTSCNSK